MRNTKVWTAFIAVFICGIVVGVTGVGLVLKYHFTPPKDPAQFHTRMRARLLDEIKDEVQPDPAAIPYIESALRDLTRELEIIRRETHPRLKEAFRKSKAQIKEHLTVEQTQRFDELVRKQKEGRGRLFRFPPPPPPID